MLLTTDKDRAAQGRFVHSWKIIGGSLKPRGNDIMSPERFSLKRFARDGLRITDNGRVVIILQAPSKVAGHSGSCCLMCCLSKDNVGIV